VLKTHSILTKSHHLLYVGGGTATGCYENDSNVSGNRRGPASRVWTIEDNACSSSGTTGRNYRPGQTNPNGRPANPDKLATNGNQMNAGLQGIFRARTQSGEVVSAR